METIDLIASGYEWICPKCNAFNTEIEAREFVTCGECDQDFVTSPPEHATG